MRRLESAFATPAVRTAAERLGIAIRDARVARRLTQIELAERASISAVTLNRIEHGSTSVAMASWLLAMERVGLLPLLEPASEAREDKLGEAVRSTERRVRVRRAKKQDDGFDF